MKPIIKISMLMAFAALTSTPKANAEDTQTQPQVDTQALPQPLPAPTPVLAGEPDTESVSLEPYFTNTTTNKVVLSPMAKQLQALGDRGVTRILLSFEQQDTPQDRAKFHSYVTTLTANYVDHKPMTVTGHRQYSTRSAFAQPLLSFKTYPVILVHSDGQWRIFMHKELKATMSPADMENLLTGMLSETIANLAKPVQTLTDNERAWDSH